MVGSVGDADLLCLSPSPDLMLAALAMLDPSIDTGEAL